MEEQRQPGAPIGPEVRQGTPEQPHHGILGGSVGRLLEKAGLRRPHTTFGSEAGKVVQQGGVITNEAVTSKAPETSATTSAVMPRAEDAGFGVSSMPGAGKAPETSADYTMRGGTLMSTAEAQRLDDGTNPYPSATPASMSERAPFTGGSEVPALTTEQVAQAVGPVVPNSVAQPPVTTVPTGSAEGVSVPPVHNLPIDGQPR